MPTSAASLHRPGLLGVLYAEDFDDDGSEPSGNGLAAEPGIVEPEIIEPVFTAADLEVARAEGRLAGCAEAERGLAGGRNQLLGQLATSLTDAKASAAAVAEAAAEGTAHCILTALAACLPVLCERHGASELRALVRALLPALSQEPRVTVRLNPHMLPMVQAEIAALDAELAACVQLVPTDAVAPGDVRVNWADGSAVRDTARARTAFEDGLALLGLLQREHQDA